MRMPRVARAVVAVFLAIVAVLGTPLAAAAVPPPSLGSSYVVDRIDALTDAQEAEVQSRLVTLSQQTGLDLWVVYVDAFTDPSDAQDWANDTANQNKLGPHQYVLAIAIDGDTFSFYLSGDVDDGELSAAQLSSIEQDRIQPALEAGDDAGAAIAAADGIRTAHAQAGGNLPVPPPTPATDSGPALGPIVLVAVLLLAIAGVLLWLFFRRRRATATATAPAENVDDLARRAGSALVATDDAIRTSEQELGFARAQFGDDAAAPFADALAQAKADLDRAFALQQQLDDDVAETPEQRRDGYTEILRLCQAADEALDAKAAAFDELRALEADAPAALRTARTRRETVAAALAAADDDLQRLRSRYAGDELSPVADNPAQARSRLDLAAAQEAEAEAALSAGRTGEAAVAIRAAQTAVAQADTLEQAIATLGSTLDAAAQRAGALVAEIEGDLAAAASLPDPDGRVAAAIASTRAQLDAARALLSAERPSPLRTVDVLQQANATIDGVLDAARDAEERRRRAEGQLDTVLAQARAQVTATEDFIAARRGAVGPTARTRLAEAGAALVQAEQLRASDPTTALTTAQRAAQLAGDAASLAQNDVGSFGGGAGGGGGDLMGAILGGIAINALSGGGRRRGGFGGGGLGPLGGLGGLGGLSGGGFGGRSRSGGGGGFSGGGRSRSGGGRGFSSGGGRSRAGGGGGRRR
ncbi:TPM domain-containing protein [Microbacterium sp. KSW2-29]|uniref:TPM domain-containing protein n=1 Tax=Microbacterium phycohabitans TaxID=3075993 RepID=A0ABU3SHM9_9MICO|nr:TPM domain-containing protein [Microbacterium sp. KSW2-29]MDU0344298.1 TPM domain-containing protein [Microbacterium sp. KSW2-29]